MDLFTSNGGFFLLWLHSFGVQPLGQCMRIVTTVDGDMQTDQCTAVTLK
jgi:hypothetical protein